MPAFVVVLMKRNAPALVVGPYRSEEAAAKGAEKHWGDVVPLLPGATPKYQVQAAYSEQVA